MKIGDRVGAIKSANDDGVYFYGYGIYEGDFIPPENVGGLNLGIKNPRIKLDNGEYVYGCECWWGNLERVKEILSNRKIFNVKPEIREE
jgi:hypothetical protein